MRKLCGFLILCLSVMLGGCATDPIDPITTDPTHIYEEVREDFLIDADVVSFPENGSVTIYEATPRKLTQEQINDFLSANGDAVVEWTNLLNPDRYFGYTADTTLDGFVRHSLSKTNMYPGNFDYWNAQSERWNSTPIYVDQQHYDDSAQFVFAHLFTEPQNFSFATVDKAEAEVRERLSILGLDKLILNRILYIDCKILSNEVTPTMQTKEWQSLAPFSNVTYNDWSEIDNGYIFEFINAIDGVPIFSREFLTDTYAYQADTITVWYQSSGITQVSASASLWNLNASTELVHRLIPVGEALATALIKLENTKVYTNTIIDKVSGEYMYIPNGDTFLFRPIWVVYATSTNKYTNITTRKFVLIDAVTGEEIM